MLSLQFTETAIVLFIIGIFLAARKILKKEALIDPTGAEFDPPVAEAVGVPPLDDAELEGTVVHTDRPGYRLGDRIIRPARVTVGRRLA